MAGKQRRERGHIVSGFESIKVIRMFANPEPSRAQLIVAVPIANSYPTPIIALENNQRPRESEPRRCGATMKEVARESEQNGSSLRRSFLK